LIPDAGEGGYMPKGHGFTPASEAAPATLHRIEDLMQWQEPQGLRTGVALFDQNARVPQGGLTLLAGRPATGKTTLALQIVRETLFRREKPLGVAMFSLAEAQEAVTTRLLALGAEVPLHALRTGFTTRAKWTSIESAAQRLSEAPLHIADDPCLTAETIADRALALAAELKSRGEALGLVVIDYLQLVRGPSGRLGQRPREIERAARNFKRLSTETGAAVLVLSQIAQLEHDTPSEEPPRPVDLGAAMTIERVADLVVLTHRHLALEEMDCEQGGEASLTVTKSHWRTGVVPVTFPTEMPIFGDVPTG